MQTAIVTVSTMGKKEMVIQVCDQYICGVVPIER